MARLHYMTAGESHGPELTAILEGLPAGIPLDAELIRDVRQQPDMFAGGLFDNDPEMDAECGTWCGEAA